MRISQQISPSRWKLGAMYIHGAAASRMSPAANHATTLLYAGSLLSVFLAMYAAFMMIACIACSIVGSVHTTGAGAGRAPASSARQAASCARRAFKWPAERFRPSRPLVGFDRQAAGAVAPAGSGVSARAGSLTSWNCFPYDLHMRIAVMMLRSLVL